MKTRLTPHAGYPPREEQTSSRSELDPRVPGPARAYLRGMLLVLLLAIVSSVFDATIYRDSVILATLLLLFLLFYRLVVTFRCTVPVRALTLFGAVAVVLGQVLNTTEELAAFDHIPVLGSASAWNAFFDGLFGKFGVVSLFAALILAVIELSGARDGLEEKSRRLAAEIDERMAAERLLAAHRYHLEELVAERTADLEASQRALLAQERLAMLGEIMASVSHEMRNPLGTVRSSLFTLKTTGPNGDPERMARALERAERNVIRCDRIIEELLDLSRARDLDRRVTPLDGWLKSVLDTAGLPDAVGCDFDLRANVNIPIDRDKMRRALMNLITNSVQAFEESPGQRQQLVVSSTRDGDACRISITDTGPGMSEDVLRKLGTPLFSTRAFGVGLGVPVVRETVRGHGGELSYESEVGKGTTVTILLPVPSNGNAAN